MIDPFWQRRHPSRILGKHGDGLQHSRSLHEMAANAPSIVSDRHRGRVLEVEGGIRSIVLSQVEHTPGCADILRDGGVRGESIPTAEEALVVFNRGDGLIAAAHALFPREDWDCLVLHRRERALGAQPVEILRGIRSQGQVYLVNGRLNCDVESDTVWEMHGNPESH